MCFAVHMIFGFIDAIRGEQSAVTYHAMSAQPLSSPPTPPHPASHTDIDKYNILYVTGLDATAEQTLNRHRFVDTSCLAELTCDLINRQFLNGKYVSQTGDDSIIAYTAEVTGLC